MKILVVDDDPQILDSLTVGFQLQWQDATVLPAEDGEAARQLFFEELPDVVVLDLNLPGVSGFQLLREFRRVSDVPVIILTARDQETDEVRGLELGADDYVVKPFSYMALIARIRAVLRRVDAPPPTRSAPDFVAGAMAISFQRCQVTIDGNPVKLTPMEYKLLYHLARNPGRVVSHEALLNHLWGSDHCATTAHLKVFASRLRSKMERPGGHRYIETERGLGYRLIIPPRN